MEAESLWRASCWNLGPALSSGDISCNGTKVTSSDPLLESQNHSLSFLESVRVRGRCPDLAGSWAMLSQTPSRHPQNPEKGCAARKVTGVALQSVQGLWVLPLLHHCAW